MRNLLLISLLLPALAMADATIPNVDLKKTADLPYLKRYDGSYIVDQVQRSTNSVCPRPSWKKPSSLMGTTTICTCRRKP